MKYFAILLITIIPFSIGFGQINNYEKEWAKIDTLEHFRKIEAAIKATENLIKLTKKDIQSPLAKAHYIKAFIYKNKYELEKVSLANQNEEETYCYLNELEALSKQIELEIKKTEDPVIRSMFHYCVAELLMQYCKDYYTCNNTREIPRRASLHARRADELEEPQIKEEVNIDPVQDSINQVLSAIALSIAEHLIASTRFVQTKKIEAQHFAILLENSEFIDTTAFRFSLYDMLLDNAIWYLDNRSSYLPYKNPYKKFPYRDSLAFVAVENFINFDFTVQDPYALRFEAYKLYQKLLTTHLQDRDQNILAQQLLMK